MHLKAIENKVNRPLQGRSILLVEDCPDQGRMYLKIMENAGAKVVLECNGQAAVDTIARNPSRFDAVIMDFQMPEMDGLVATLTLRRNDYAGQIVAISANSSNRLRESWLDAGCDVFLPKSSGTPELIRTLQKCLSSVAVG